jgi:uncharacterized membrane protein
MGHEYLVRVLGGMVGIVVLVPMTALWITWLVRRGRSLRG